MVDEILREGWQTKDRLAKRFKNDIDALASELRKHQRKSAKPKRVATKKKSPLDVPSVRAVVTTKKLVGIVRKERARKRN